MPAGNVYFGKLLLFLTIAFFQSAITAAGDLFILHVDVQEKAWFILFGIGIGAVFTVMVYTLVSVFGNVGKALGIVLLVLQISGSGGTFPIQMEPSFFQHIHPLLPFTYGIGLMREAVGGMLMEAVITDIIYLAGFLAIALIFGTAAKKLFSRMTERFTTKGKESGLFE
ncbi:YhgE/Pip domain-containing protein [Heyndrickxia coagulans]|uniref:YhgE/Pip family protein n=1 Tax=Heyndrickxia coagulans TaxID=1398 RepID=UPI0021F22A4A|nr:YhgE/Pip domain-containing protein [Heyndrickxia coagulans]UYM81559.1 YhgE/Pip domain-containing protein [Heyndrickxia coagulans]